MNESSPTLRQAMPADIPLLADLIARSARQLCVKDYTPREVEAALEGAFGVDSELIADGTYFALEADGALLGCGGWSKRGTMFGGDAHKERDSSLLDPEKDPAKIRAFFIEPSAAGRGLGEIVLRGCEEAARAHGFTRFTLMATLTGSRFYRRHGYVGEARKTFLLGADVPVDFIPMTKG